MDIHHVFNIEEPGKSQKQSKVGVIRVLGLRLESMAHGCLCSLSVVPEPWIETYNKNKYDSEKKR